MLRSKSSYSVLAIFILLQLLFIFLRKTSTGAVYYGLVRLHTLVNAEFIMLLSSFYIWRRITFALGSLEPSTITPARLRFRTICFQDVARAFLIFFLFLAQGSFVFYYIFIGTEPNVLAVFSLTSLATYIHICVFLLLADLVLSASVLSSKLGGSNDFHTFMNTNRGFHILLAVLCALIFIMGGLYSTFRQPVVTKVTIPMRKVEGSGDGLKVALLSDIHLGPTVGYSRMETIARLTNSLNPDIIAISGDLADGFVRDLGAAAQPLCSLKAKYGVYFATGNHEYAHGNVEEWFSFLRNCNITVLHNSNSRIVHGNSNFCIAGTDDLYAVKAHLPDHGMDPKKALTGCHKDDFTIFLAHQPNAAKIILSDSATSNKVDLVLSGHTHGGQLYIFVPFVYIFNAFTRGLYEHVKTGAYVYVSAGVNFFGPPVKLFGACEIIDITLTHM